MTLTSGSDRSMAIQGFPRIDNVDEADFYVRYYLSLKRETSYVSSTTGVYGGYGWGWGYGYGGGVNLFDADLRLTRAARDVVQRHLTLAWRHDQGRGAIIPDAARGG
jgi:hypothetical protein